MAQGPAVTETRALYRTRGACLTVVRAVSRYARRAVHGRFLASATTRTRPSVCLCARRPRINPGPVPGPLAEGRRCRALGVRSPRSVGRNPPASPAAAQSTHPQSLARAVRGRRDSTAWQGV